MARFKIVPLGQIEDGKRYRLVSAPSTSWTRNKGIVSATKKGKFVLLSAEKGNSNDFFQSDEYGRTWGLQEINDE